MLWFAVGALASSLAASRTIFKNVFMRTASHLKTGIEAMLGQEAVVVESLGEPHGGTVRINGELWSARSLSGLVAEGERVTVEQVEGLKLWVRRPSASLSVPVAEPKKERA
jgi:membrane protein implicated in regulation of membrane protease activity